MALIQIRRRTPRPLYTLTLVFVLGLFMARLPSTLGHFGAHFDFIDPIEDVYRLLADEYVNKPDAEKLQTGAISGMLEALDDPYAEYIPPAGRAEFTKEIAGQFVGIGAQVENVAGWLTIVSPLEDSPAFKAGIMAGDRVTEIDGVSTLNVPIDQSIAKLTGTPGTPVNITIDRHGEVIPMTLTRQEIVVKAVKGVRRADDNLGRWDFMLDPDRKIAYVRLSQFIPTAPSEMAEALVGVGADKPGFGGLILDLRSDPGGDLNACLAIADLFLREGVVVSVRGRSGSEQVYRAQGGGDVPDFPMIVMINGQSASASEILAGALSDHNRAVVLGTRSYGKGLVQSLLPVPHTDGGQVKFTTQRYYLPSGRLIHREDDSTTWGVDPAPGFYVPMSEDEFVASFLKRQDLDVIRTTPSAPPNGAPAKEKANAEPARWSDPDWITGTLQDKQFAAALKAMQTRVAVGQWQPVSDQTEQAGAIKTSEIRALERGRDRLAKELTRLDRRIEALDAAAEGTKPLREPRDLWPNDLNLTDGHVKVFDREGKQVADLRITGRDLERWLADADVEPEPGTDGNPAEKPAKAPSAPAPQRPEHKE